MSANDRGIQARSRARAWAWVVAGATLLAADARAHYLQYGDGMATILSGSLDHAALNIQSAMTWTNDVPAGGSYVFDAAFAAPTADAVHLSRLWLTLWGGTRDYTCDLAVGINGAALPFASVSLGGTNDANGIFSGTGINVYGTGYGVWLVSLPVPEAGVKIDGTTNVFEVSITDPSGSFDKRCVQATFLTLYESMSLTNRLSWFLGEGSGDIYRGTAGAAANCTLALGTTPPGDLDSATLTALYTYGDYAQNDRLILNGTPVGGDNVADHADNFAALNYVPDLVSFDVTALVAQTNVVKFSVDTADGVPDTRESSLRPSLALLTISQPVPEPASAGLLLLGGAAVLAARRRRA